MRTDLLTRPWSCHKAKVKGYEPAITGKIERVGRGKYGWRSTTSVGGVGMATSHHATKTAAEDATARMMESYTQVHYVDKGAA